MLSGTQPHGLSTAELLVFSLKSRRVENYPDILDKIHLVYEKIENNLPLDDNTKFSRLELALLLDIASFEQTLETLNKHGLLDDKLAAMYSLAKKAKAVKEKIEVTFNMNFTIRAGTICLDSTEKIFETSDKKPDCLDHFIFRNITKQGHTVLLTQEPASRVEHRVSVIVSHLNPTRKTEPFSFERYLTSDIYYLNFIKLISRKAQQMLQEKMGESWLLYVKERYHAIEMEALKNTQDANLTVDINQALKAATLSLLGIIGHTRFKPYDFNLVREKMFSAYYQKNPAYMLCSEFVARIIIASIIALNQELKKELKTTEEVIYIPFNPYENLPAVHPGRLLAILKDFLIKDEPSEQVRLYCRL